MSMKPDDLFFNLQSEFRNPQLKCPRLAALLWLPTTLSREDPPFLESL